MSRGVVTGAITQRRAEVVIAYLVGRGVDGSRLRPTALGSSQPIADNATAAGRAANRRSEIVVEGGR